MGEEIKDFFFQKEGEDENKLGVEKLERRKRGSHYTAHQKYTVKLHMLPSSRYSSHMLLFNHHYKLLVLGFASLNYQSNISNHMKNSSFFSTQESCS
jgi:hypothetical protein